MKERIAIIDLGTNTFHLLIAEYENAKDYHILDRNQVPVFLGKGGINQGHLTKEAYQRGIDALREFKDLIGEWNAKTARIIGTSALRSADNAPDFLEQIEELFSCKVELIDGDEEAELIYKGVRLAVGMWEEPSLILDIGGGSVEFIVANKNELYWKKSLEIGAARLIDRYPHDFPPTEDQKIAILDYLASSLESVFNELKSYNLSALIGASGFFETYVNLERHKQETNPPVDFPLHYKLNIERFHVLKKQILTGTKDQLFNMPGMEAFRVEMMVVSTLLVDLIIEHTGISTIYYSNYAVKEGVLNVRMSK